MSPNECHVNSKKIGNFLRIQPLSEVGNKIIAIHIRHLYL